MYENGKALGFNTNGISDDFLADPIFRAMYLLYLEGHSSLDNARMRLEFILWFLVHGRSSFAHPFVVTDRMIEAVTQPDADGRHLLMNFAVSQFKPSCLSDPFQSRANYYNDLLLRFGSARFLGENELRFVAECQESLEGRLQLSPLSARAAKAVDLSCVLQLARNIDAKKQLPSVSIIGFHRSVLGIGEDARMLFHCLIEAGIRSELVDLSPPNLTRYEPLDQYRPFETDKPSSSIHLFCMPPFEMMRAIAKLGLQASHTRTHRIGIWPWETSELPPEWTFAFEYLDELWAISTFCRQVFADAASGKLITLMPLPVEVDPPSLSEVVSELINGQFCVLSVFDFNSRIERKNPIGAIKAFRSAFPHEQRAARLVFKTINQRKNKPAFETIMDEIGNDERIIIADGAISREELSALVSSASVYLSLHRAEGLGRSLIEAMLLGTPVVATQWSGSADFVSEETGYPIRSSLIPVNRSEYPHGSGQWADPDIDQAADALKSIYENPDEAYSRSVRAMTLVSHRYSRLTASRAIRKHIEALDLARKSK